MGFKIKGKRMTYSRGTRLPSLARKVSQLKCRVCRGIMVPSAHGVGHYCPRCMGLHHYG